MSTFGDRLKQAREAKGVTLDSIADATNISRRYLEALEKGDLQTLPGGAFNKGYIRTFAEFLRTDPQPILDAYNAEERRTGHGTPESEQHLLQEISRLVDKQIGKRKGRVFLFFSSGLGFALTVTALMLLAAGTWFFLTTARVEDRGLVLAPPAESRPAARTGEPIEHARVSVPLPDHPDAADVEEPPAVKESRVQTPIAIPSSSGQAGSELTASTETVPAPPAPAERESAGASGLRVSGAAVGREIVQRNIVGQSDRFPEGQRVFFWTRVIGGESGEIIRHIWKHEGRTVMLAELSIGGPHWRTYSSYTPPPGSEGRWVVEARAPDNRLLAQVEFRCFQPPD